MISLECGWAKQREAKREYRIDNVWETARCEQRTGSLEGAVIRTSDHDMNHVTWLGNGNQALGLTETQTRLTISEVGMESG